MRNTIMMKNEKQESNIEYVQLNDELKKLNRQHSILLHEYNQLKTNNKILLDAIFKFAKIQQDTNQNISQLSQKLDNIDYINLNNTEKIINQIQPMQDQLEFHKNNINNNLVQWKTENKQLKNKLIEIQEIIFDKKKSPEIKIQTLINMFKKNNEDNLLKNNICFQYNPKNEISFHK